MSRTIASIVAFSQDIAGYLNTDKTVVLIGDFSCVSRSCDRPNSCLQPHRSIDALNRLVHDCHLVDIGAIQHIHIWYTHFHGFSSARLDHIYVSSRIWDAISDHLVQPVLFADHCMVSVCFEERKPRILRPSWDLWKFFMYPYYAIALSWGECLHAYI